jgi:SnoaL-like domain
MWAEQRVHHVFICKFSIGDREALIGRWTHVECPGRLDAIGVVVDWIDACKQRRLDELLDLYDATATVECCEGGSFRGRSEMERYWRPRLARAVTGAFEIDALFPEADGATLDYRGYDGVPVRTHFRFTSTGKISLTACAPIRAAA